MSTASDYLFDQPVLAGSARVGPDLANVGVRAPEKYSAPWKFTSTNTFAEFRAWQLRHLAEPRAVAPGSTMPAYRFLFDQRAEGKVPKHDAEALVAYLFSLRQDVPLPNAPLPRVASVKPAATNAPAATNTPAK
ncbi:MAG: cbb3-type cytochrome c oxidase subunit II [Verrucomicrobia bacterium]|nr:cbb3-type cytochrome c oxidase subunit II [Verrucomicrobiota bacterium]